MVELETGRLKWDGILHTPEFFQQNARKFEGPDCDFAPLKKLIRLLQRNVTTARYHEDDNIKNEALAILCFDLGEFVRLYPNGKIIANRFGAKALVMPLMDHECQDVRKNALQCISKMLVTNWMAIDN